MKSLDGYIATKKNILNKCCCLLFTKESRKMHHSFCKIFE